jgi:hypothetical protein
MCCVHAESSNSIISEEYIVKEEDFSYSAASEDLQYTFSALKSFRELTDLIEEKTNFRDDYARLMQQKKSTDGVIYSINISLDEIRKVDNVGWSIQNIGFPNREIIIEGTLLRQNEQIQMLEYEMLKLKKANQKDIEQARDNYFSAKKILKEFIEAHPSWSD